MQVFSQKLHIMKTNTVIPPGRKVSSTMVDQGNVKQKEHFFSICVFFHKYSQFTGHEGEGWGWGPILLTPLISYTRFTLSQAITAEKSPLHIVTSRIITENLWFLSASRNTATYLVVLLRYDYCFASPK